MASAALSLRPAGEGADLRQIFRESGTGRTRVLSGTVVHVLAVAALLLAARIIPDRVYRAVLPERLADDLVYLAQPGPGGGGGGGDRSPEPPARAELKGPDQTSVPAAAPPEPVPVESQPFTDTPPEPQLNIPLVALAGGNEVRLGDLLGAAPNNGRRGPGDGEGAGGKKGIGIGDGGPDGIGGGPSRGGNGVLPPRLKLKVDPQYSAEAMRAKIQGIVLLAAVVQPNGRVTDIRVVRSLDQTFGLDMKAIEAARKWEFYPATRSGEPVPFLVNLELEFNLR